uniref:Uncharacterized protein n=1 Tax=Vitis vinifera TaxID=29760 RepID=F6GZ64_VITVI
MRLFLKCALTLSIDSAWWLVAQVFSRFSVHSAVGKSCLYWI